MYERRGSGRWECSPGGRRKRRPAPWSSVIIVGVALLGPAALPVAPALAYEQRPNTFSLGIQGGAGMISGQGEYVVQSPIDPAAQATVYPYDKFDWGGALAIRLRYSLDPGHALGISMEDLRFSRLSGQAQELNLGSSRLLYPKQFQATTYLLDYYLYLNLEDLGILGRVGRRYKNCPYLVLGAGLQRDAFRFSPSDIAFPGLGFVAHAGLGWEYFIARPFSLDATARAYYLKFDGGSGVAGEATLGFQYYLLH
jgi:hypothetical protein